ncbi:MAG: hypothetical protein Q9210_001092 [Variospora velana]
MHRRDDAFHTTASDKNLRPVLHGLGQHRSALSADIYRNFLEAATSVFLPDRLHLRRFPILSPPQLEYPPPIVHCAVLPDGLGIVTGGIAVAWTGTTDQIKSPDLSWVSVPNSVTRMFEVNIGNIAACVPIMKPFLRYARAKITGRDLHQILQRKTSDSEFHPRWYGREWWLTSRVSSKEVGMAGQHEMGISRGRSRPRPIEAEEKSVKTGTSRPASITFPIQGMRGTHNDQEQRLDVPEIRNSRWFRLSEIRQMDFDDLYAVKDAV